MDVSVATYIWLRDVGCVPTTHIAPGTLKGMITITPEGLRELQCGRSIVNLLRHYCCHRFDTPEELEPEMGLTVASKRTNWSIVSKILKDALEYDLSWERRELIIQGDAVEVIVLVKQIHDLVRPHRAIELDQRLRHREICQKQTTLDTTDLLLKPWDSAQHRELRKPDHEKPWLTNADLNKGKPEPNVYHLQPLKKRWKAATPHFKRKDGNSGADDPSSSPPRSKSTEPRSVDEIEALAMKKLREQREQEAMHARPAFSTSRAGEVTSPPKQRAPTATRKPYSPPKSKESSPQNSPQKQQQQPPQQQQQQQQPQQQQQLSDSTKSGDNNKSRSDSNPETPLRRNQSAKKVKVVEKDETKEDAEKPQPASNDNKPSTEESDTKSTADAQPKDSERKEEPKRTEEESHEPSTSENEAPKNPSTNNKKDDETPAHDTAAGPNNGSTTDNDSAARRKEAFDDSDGEQPPAANEEEAQQDDEEDVPPPANRWEDSRLSYVERVEAVFQRFDPSKKDKAAALCERNAGNEEALIRKLLKKFESSSEVQQSPSSASLNHSSSQKPSVEDSSSQPPTNQEEDQEAQKRQREEEEREKQETQRQEESEAEARRQQKAEEEEEREAARQQQEEQEANQRREAQERQEAEEEEQRRRQDEEGAAAQQREEEEEAARRQRNLEQQEEEAAAAAARQKADEEEAEREREKQREEEQQQQQSDTPPPAADEPQTEENGPNENESNQAIWEDKSRSHLERIQAVFAEYDPKKTDKAQTLLDKNKGKEEAVINALVKKYAAAAKQ